MLFETDMAYFRSSIAFAHQVSIERGLSGYALSQWLLSISICWAVCGAARPRMGSDPNPMSATRRTTRFISESAFAPDCGKIPLGSRESRTARGPVANSGMPPLSRACESGLVVLIGLLAGPCECETRVKPPIECREGGPLIRWWESILCDDEQRERLERARIASRIGASARLGPSDGVQGVRRDRKHPRALKCA